MLAKYVFVANAHSRRLALVFQILRRLANDAAGEELIAGADDGLARQVNVRSDDALRPDPHAFINDCVRAHSYGGVEGGFRVNDCSWVNHE